MSISWKERFDLSTVEEVLTRRWERVLTNIHLGAPSPLLEKLSADLTFLDIPNLTIRRISLTQPQGRINDLTLEEFWRSLGKRLYPELKKLIGSEKILCEGVMHDFFLAVHGTCFYLVGEKFTAYKQPSITPTTPDKDVIALHLLLDKNLVTVMAADLAYTWQRPDAQHYFVPLMDLMAAGNWPLGFIEPNVLLVLTS